MKNRRAKTILGTALVLGAVVVAGIALLLLRGQRGEPAAQSGDDGRGPGGAVAQAPAQEQPLRYDVEYPTLHYATAPRTDPVAQLENRIARGEVKLELGPRGYLDSLLAALHVDPSSQTLVFSQTSLQSRRIRPETPRAIYFNDDVYVAWVQQGPIEIGSLDPNLGPVFYLLDNRPGAGFARELTRCLSCHDSYSLSGEGVPRFIVGSGYTGAEGQLVSHEGWILVADETPLKSRWGGWYVTGHHGKQVHLGNVLIRSSSDFQRLDELRVGNIDTLDGLFDTKSYLTNESDIVALMILEHQVNAQNAITRVNFDVRTAIDRERGFGNASRGYDQRLSDLSSEMRKTVEQLVEPLVRALLFADETQLTDPIEGDPKFVEQFSSRAVRDPKGRSLRDLDMHTRMFRYPLSYTIYSPAFDALPRAAREAVYARVSAVLRGTDRTQGVPRLASDERDAMLDILTATKADFADWLSRSAPAAKL
jgi:hypothetical protein